jgi:hypothetical protein
MVVSRKTKTKTKKNYLQKNHPIEERRLLNQ